MIKDSNKELSQSNTSPNIPLYQQSQKRCTNYDEFIVNEEYKYTLLYTILIE